MQIILIHKLKQLKIHCVLQKFTLFTVIFFFQNWQDPGPVMFLLLPFVNIPFAEEIHCSYS